MAQSPRGHCRQEIRQHPHPQHHCVFMQSSLPSFRPLLLGLKYSMRLQWLWNLEELLFFVFRCARVCRLQRRTRRLHTYFTGQLGQLPILPIPLRVYSRFSRDSPEHVFHVFPGEHHGVFQRTCREGENWHRDRQGGVETSRIPSSNPGK